MDTESTKKFLFLIIIMLCEKFHAARRRRRRMYFNLILMQSRRSQQILELYNQLYPNRRMWSLPMPQGWFEYYHSRPNFFPDDWPHRFRLSRPTFDFLCSLLHQDLLRTDTRFRRAIPVAKRVAVGLWWLATGNSYAVIRTVFGIGVTSVERICKEFVEALSDHGSKFIKFPRTETAILHATEAFRHITKLPNVVGAIDGTHFPVTAPEHDAFDYFDRYQRYSISAQGVVTGDLQFLSISTGYPGSLHDGRVLRNSWIFDAAQQRRILASPCVTVNNTLIRPILLGDSAYPLTPWLMKPFSDTGSLTEDQKRFNYELSRARVVVERAFGILKGRWRILMNRMPYDIKLTVQIIKVCAILHNICQVHHETEEAITEGEHERISGADGNTEVISDSEAVRTALITHVKNLYP